MKLFPIIISISLFLISCKGTYECTCDDGRGNISREGSFTGVSSSEADALCQDREVLLNDRGVNYSCVSTELE